MRRWSRPSTLLRHGYLRCDAKVCVRIQRGACPTTTVTTWSSLSSEILELADYLSVVQVSLVVMEATGDYWEPFYYRLVRDGTGGDVGQSSARPVRSQDLRSMPRTRCGWPIWARRQGPLRGSFVSPSRSVT